MNGRISKLLRKVARGKAHYRRLKKQYKKIPAPERRAVIENLKEKADDKKSVALVETD